MVELRAAVVAEQSLVAVWWPLLVLCSKAGRYVVHWKKRKSW